MIWNVFDLNFERKGIIKGASKVSIEHYYHAHGYFELAVKPKLEADEFGEMTLLTKQAKEQFQAVRTQVLRLLFSEEARNEGRIITKITDPSKGYLVRVEQLIDGEIDGTEELHIKAYGLSYMMHARSIIGQQAFSGNIEQAMRYFVDVNCINPSNPNRVIENLILGDLSGIDINVDVAFWGNPLDQVLFDICKPHNVSYDILMDHTNKKYVFVVYQGSDRSKLQSVNEPVVLAKKYGNVARESFLDDRTSHKTTAIVVGTYEETFEPYDYPIYENDNLSGLNRWETVIDVRGEVKSYYTGPDDVDYSMTEQEYEAALKARGAQAITDYKRTRALESEIVEHPDFVFGTDFFMGDIISSLNDELGIIMHRRVVQAVEVYDEHDEYSLSLSFGDVILEFADWLKRELRYK